jgi:two-component system, NtrC family, sensor kinase
VPGKAVGRAAVDLPWLCPNTDSLVGLAENPANLPRLASADPALFVFLVRFAMGEGGSPFIPASDRLVSSSLPEVAAAYVNATSKGWLDPTSWIATTLGQFSDRAAAQARQLAEQTRRVFPEAAETAARLAPLGWFAVAAADESEASACLHDPAFITSPGKCQRTWWELDHDAIARRLAARWKLPSWLATIVGCLNMPFEAALHSGSDSDLFAVVSLAVHAAETQTANLGLTAGMDRERVLVHLGLTADDIQHIGRSRAGGTTPSYHPAIDQNPHRVPLVANLLRSAGQMRRRSGAALVVRREERIDELHQTAASLAELAGHRLRDAKLAALAEFAAGAGHEINNPLAVIAGNAQRLLRTEQDDDRADTLRAIVRQSQRISGILRELMQFARPPQAEATLLPVRELLESVRDELLPLAEERRVRLELLSAPSDLWLNSDGKQIRQALAAVVRNGIEAAGEDGWVRVSCSTAESELQVIVEDSGPGLTRAVAEHAFDPFYSGRSAGRGRGLGLATAWQFTRGNGGSLRLDSAADGPTRFVLSLPLAESPVGSALRSA